MALVLNEEQSMLRDSARGLISDKAPVSHLRQLRDAKDATGFSRDLWRTSPRWGLPDCWCRRTSAAADLVASKPAW